MLLVFFTAISNDGWSILFFTKTLIMTFDINPKKTILCLLQLSFFIIISFYTVTFEKNIYVQ